MGHTVEVKYAVSDVSSGNFRDLLGDAVECFISEILGNGATATGEDFDEPGANLLVFSSGLLRIRVKPSEELVKRPLV
jgi:hypothetical protein